MPPTAVAPPVDEYIHVDPKDLHTNGNVRQDLGDLSGLVTSIKSMGVLEPIVASRDDDGTLRIVAGKRRHAAALKAKSKTVPVRVLEGLDNHESQLIAMLIENLQREDLSAVEEADAYQQLTLLQVAPRDIAAQTGLPVDRVKQGIRLAGTSEEFRAELGPRDLSLDHAAGIAEFEGDTDATKKLLDTLETNPARWDHELQMQRNRAKVQAEAAKMRADLERKGTRVIPAGANKNEPAGRKGAPVGLLRTATGASVTPQAHAKCPGHIAHVDTGWNGDTEPTVSWYCDDWEANGHRHAYKPTSAEKPKAPKKTDAEIEADRNAQAEIEANRAAFEAAIEVRRRWVRDLIARKTAPKELGRWIHLQLLTYAGEDVLAGYGDLDVHAELTGLEKNPMNDKATAAELHQRTDAQLQLLVFGTIATGCECELEDAGDRAFSEAGRWYGPVVEYLKLIAELGYELSDVEQLVINDGQAPKKARAAKKATKAAASS